eukprot:10966326-Prorocentrum_lima.AAC.1
MLFFFFVVVVGLDSSPFTAAFGREASVTSAVSAASASVWRCDLWAMLRPSELSFFSAVAAAPGLLG